MDPMLSLIVLLTFTGIFASLFQRIGINRVIGYLFGGIVVYALNQFGKISIDLQYTEPLKQIGLILFFFEVGSMFKISEMKQNFTRVLSAELVALTIYWISASFLSFLLFSSELEKLVLFLLLTNCSTASIVALLSKREFESLIPIAAFQTSLEDMIQFFLFSMILTVGSSPLTLQDVVLSLIKLSGSALFLYFLSTRALRRLQGSSFLGNPTNKFLLALLMALLFSTISDAMGLPSFFGAFIAGLSFNASIGKQGIGEMTEGLWELGLLFYFSSIGSELVSILSMESWMFMIGAGIAFGIMSFVIRSVALSVGEMMGGVPLESSVKISFILSTLSENGIIFTEMLGTKGIISPSLTGISITAVISSLLLQSQILSRTEALSSLAIRAVPGPLLEKMAHISKLYYLSVDSALRIFTITSYFFASLLAITYSIDALQAVLQRIEPGSLGKNAILIASLLRSAGIVAVLIIFFFSMRSLYRLNLEGRAIGEESLRKLKGAIGILASAIAIAVQANILKDVLSNFGMQIIGPLELIIVFLSIAAIALNIFLAWKYRPRNSDAEKLK
ncbi:MAG: cation:proton antiporter [Fervidicoccaceae archaeon]